MSRSSKLFLIWLCITSLLDPAWSDCGPPVFREGAADRVKASFKKGLSRTDFTKIEILASLFSLVEDGACVDVERMSLQHNNDGGEDWEVVDAKPNSVGGGKYEFIIEDVVPCMDHYFKLTVPSKGWLPYFNPK